MMRFARQIASTLHDVQNKSGKTTKDAKKRDLKAALDESIKFRQGLGLHDGALLAALLRQEEEMMSESLVSDAEYDQYDPIVVKIRSEPKTGNEANREDKIEEELPVSMDNCEALSVPVNVTTNVKIESETANNSEVMIESENGPTKMTQPASSEILYDGGKSGNVQKCLQPSTEFLKTLSCKYGWRFDHNPHLFMTIEDVRTTKPLTTHDVDGDGNCGFRALSYALTGCEDNHKLIREKVANYVYYDHAPKRFYKAHPTAKTNSMMKQYTAKSPLDKARWMSTSDMVAAACLLGVNILSFSDDLTWKLNNRNSISGKTGVMNDGPSILLDNSSRIHFQVVTNVTQK
uniref:OTU domain-containing protein n=1 Tax=Panagrellus redivivus TaxID=6233 RepID=A0A7E4VE13_PANRE